MFCKKRYCLVYLTYNTTNYPCRLCEFCPRQNKLRFEGIKEHQNESWEDCENKIYDLLENKLEMDNENAFIDSSNKNIELGRNTRIDHDLKLLKFRFLRTRLIFKKL